MKINCFAVPAVGDRNAGSVIFQNCASESSVEGVPYARNCHHLHKIPPGKESSQRFGFGEQDALRDPASAGHRSMFGLILCQAWVCRMGGLASSVSSRSGRRNSRANPLTRGSGSQGLESERWAWKMWTLPYCPQLLHVGFLPRGSCCAQKCTAGRRWSPPYQGGLSRQAGSYSSSLGEKITRVFLV